VIAAETGGARRAELAVARMVVAGATVGETAARCLRRALLRLQAGDRLGLELLLAVALDVEDLAAVAELGERDARPSRPARPVRPMRCV
jgi:hypothetical protein